MAMTKHFSVPLLPSLKIVHINSPILNATFLFWFDINLLIGAKISVSETDNFDMQSALMHSL